MAKIELHINTFSHPLGVITNKFVELEHKFDMLAGVVAFEAGTGCASRVTAPAGSWPPLNHDEGLPPPEPTSQGNLKDSRTVRPEGDSNQ